MTLLFSQGWDWGPKLVTCGPWKPIYLDISSSRIADVSVQTSLGQDLRDAKVDIVAKVDGDALHANIEILSKGVLVQSQRVKVQSETAHAIFNIKHPDLWWPFTLGPANLYEVNVSLHTGGDSAPCVVDEVKKSFGIRKVELIQQPLPGQEGTSFFFKVNNVPIFAAGSCWIPADSFLTRLTPQKYRDWVTLAREANQVMIRIWGGGIYEDEAFYNSCDELGVLVWQDFMFACGIYPAYEPMQKRVAVEADQNVRRLRHHPSIVLWCGNNEDYAIPLIVKMEYDAEEKDPQKVLGSSFPARYFYEHMLPAICNDLAPDTPYWPGSPFGGSMCNSQEIGDIHQWHVWHMDKFPYQDYPRLSGRFVSEFGMQALPGLDTVKEYFPPGHEVLVGGDVSANEYLEWHNKNEAGASTLALYGQNNIPFETTSLPAYIYCTQLIQNETLSTAYRSWRRLWRGPGKEYCAGALVWQLNDCWPVTSWAIADYRLRPKMAYWAVKRECAPITAGAARIKEQDRTTKLDVWAVNMTLADVQVNVSIDAWHTVTGEKLLNHSMHRGLTLKENRSAELGILDLDSILSARLPASEREQGYRNVAFAVRLNKSATPVYRLAQSINFHEPLHEVSFQAGPADLKTRITKRGIATVLEITTSFPVKGFLVEITDDADATWDENGIDLVPGETTVLKCTSQGLRVGQEHRLKARWLGGEWEGGRDIKASL